MDTTGQSSLQRIIKTVFLVIVWICIGLCLEITGPTLIDLKIRTNSNFETVATAVAGRSAGFFVGSALGGLLVDKLGGYCDLFVAICLDGMAVFTAALPWAQQTELMYFISLCQGTFEGVINIAGQKLIINMWKEKSASPLHILHGGFGIGAFIIPLIVNPFLAVTESPTKNTTDTAVSGSSTWGNLTSSTTMLTTTTSESGDDDIIVKESRIEYGYSIAAMIAVAVSLVFYVYQCQGLRNRCCGDKGKVGTYTDPDKQDGEDADVGDDTGKGDQKAMTFREMFNPATCAGGNFIYGLQIIVLVFLFFTQAVGGERVAGKFIRTFAIDYLDFSKDEGTYINTAFWIAFSCGRVAAFVAARWVPIRILIIIETGGCLVSAVALVVFGTSGPLALWVIMPTLGVFIAPLFPSGIGWANFHIEVTGITITVFLLGGSIGGIAYMKLIGFLYDNYGPKTFLYTLLGYAIAAFVLSVLMNIIGARHGNKYNGQTVVDDVAQHETKYNGETEVLEDGNKYNGQTVVEDEAQHETKYNGQTVVVEDDNKCNGGFVAEDDNKYNGETGVEDEAQHETKYNGQTVVEDDTKYNGQTVVEEGNKYNGETVLEDEAQHETKSNGQTVVEDDKYNGQTMVEDDNKYNRETMVEDDKYNGQTEVEDDNNSNGETVVEGSAMELRTGWFGLY